MKIIYIYDHKFINNTNKYYSEGKFTNQIFSRYDIFDSDIYIISREVRSHRVDNLNLINKENIFFSPVKGTNFYKIFSLYLIYNLIFILKNIIKSKGMIIRMPSILGIFVLLINLFIHKPYFIELVGDGKESWMHNKSNPGLFYTYFAVFLDVLRKYFIKNACGVIYVTQYSLQKKYPTKGFTEYASNVEVHVENLNLNIENYKIRNAIKIGLIGSFNNDYKGIEVAIKALSILRKKKYNIYLHILGSGTLIDYYKSLAKENGLEGFLHFDGSLEGGKPVHDWLDTLDIYIQPSYTEGLPRALIEAMSRGLPAVASHVGGIPELLDTKFLVPAKNFNLLAEKIEIFILSQKLRFDAGTENYERAKNFDANVLAQRRTNFWRKAYSLLDKN